MIIGSKVKLTRVISNHTRLRTNDVIGIVKQLPVVGMAFMMQAEPLDKTKDFRWVETSPIQSVELLEDDTYKIHTQNSEYLLELLEY